jgi:phosphoadenosine phosphosulfate reductase
MDLKTKADISTTIIQMAVERWPKIFAACSFGKDSIVIIDLARHVKPDFVFAAIDTGYEFPETLEFGDSLAKELGLNLMWLRPTDEERRHIDEEYENSFIKNDQYKCCEMKIPTIHRYLHNHDAWITGLRTDETEYRKHIGIVEHLSKVKVNPIAFWTRDDVWAYIREKRLRYNPLYDQGYESLGCKPCTTMGRVHLGGGRQGRFERAGRFAGTGHAGGECGLHTRI